MDAGLAPRFWGAKPVALAQATAEGDGTALGSCKFRPVGCSQGNCFPLGLYATAEDLFWGMALYTSAAQ